jgi:hypothetical protein
VMPKQSRDGTCRSDDGGGHDSRLKRRRAS